MISILYGALLVIATFQQALRTMDTGTTLSSVDIPQGPAYLIVPVGLFFMSLAMLLDMRKVRKERVSPFSGGFSHTSPEGELDQRMEMLALPFVVMVIAFCWDCRSRFLWPAPVSWASIW